MGRDKRTTRKFFFFRVFRIAQMARLLLDHRLQTCLPKQASEGRQKIPLSNAIKWISRCLGRCSADICDGLLASEVTIDLVECTLIPS